MNFTKDIMMLFVSENLLSSVKIRLNFERMILSQSSNNMMTFNLTIGNLSFNF